MSAQPLHTANRAELAPLGGAPPPDIIETTLQHNPESPDERIMSAQPLHTVNRADLASSSAPPILACTRFNNKTWQEYQTWLSAYQQSYEQIYQRPLKCIYGAPREISHKKFPPQAKILVIEMNNDENKIMGIGEIINQTASEAYRSNNNKPQTTAAARVKFNIFSDRNYTRYIYIGNTRYASREELERNHTEDAQYINEQLEGLLPQQFTPPSPSPPHPPSNSTVGEYLRQNHPHPDPPSWGGGTPGGTPLERLLFKGARHMKRGSGISRCSVDTLLHTAKPRSTTTQVRASPLKTKEPLQPPLPQ